MSVASPSSEPAPSAPRWRCCSSAPGCARRCSAAAPEQAAELRARRARTSAICRAWSCRGSCTCARSAPSRTTSAAPTSSSSPCPPRRSPTRSARSIHLGIRSSAGIVSLAKGLVPPDGTPPTVALEAAFGRERVACIGGPAHAREMVERGRGSCARRTRRRWRTAWPTCSSARASSARSRTTRSGWSWPGWRRTRPPWRWAPPQAQGLNAAGMAAADIFLEVLALAERGRPGAHVRWPRRHGRPRGHGARAAVAQPQRRRAARPRAFRPRRSPSRLGQAVEALETVRAARPGDRARGLEAPVIVRARAPDRRHAAARRVDPAGARGAARAGSLRGRLRGGGGGGSSRGSGGAGSRARSARLDRREARDPSRVRRGPRVVHVRQRVHDPLDQARAARGDLLELPPVLHGPAEARGHRRPRRAVPAPRRQQHAARPRNSRASELFSTGYERMRVLVAAALALLWRRLAAGHGQRRGRALASKWRPRCRCTRCSRRGRAQAVFRGVMRRVAGTERMAMRFTLLEKPGTERLPARRDAEARRWHSSRLGVAVFGYEQRVRGPRRGRVYRVRVELPLVRRGRRGDQAPRAGAPPLQRARGLPNLRVTDRGRANTAAEDSDRYSSRS